MTSASAGQLRVGVVGCGFWARYQAAAWLETGEARVEMLYDSDHNKAAALAARLGQGRVASHLQELFDSVDVVDIIAPPAAHHDLVLACARAGKPVICQKPLSETLEQGEAMVAACAAAGVPLLVHENYRWQAPIRAVKQEMDEGWIGGPFRARLSFNFSFPVFDNQPALAKMERFILADVGVHLFDTVRYLFGEAQWLMAQTARIHPDIQGEDVATVQLGMESGMHVLVEMSYATRREGERFPEFPVFVEGRLGTLHLVPGPQLRRTTHEGVISRDIEVPAYTWMDPDYAVNHSCMVALHRNFAAHLRGEKPAETTGADNLRSLKMVFAAYESAERGELRHL